MDFMKKLPLYIFLVLGFLFSNNLLARDSSNDLYFFDYWLFDNGYSQYLDKDSIKEGRPKNNLNIQ